MHDSLRGQLEAFDDPKEAYDHLLTRRSVTDARARDMALAIQIRKSRRIESRL